MIKLIIMLINILLLMLTINCGAGNNDTHNFYAIDNTNNIDSGKNIDTNINNNDHKIAIAPISFTIQPRSATNYYSTISNNLQYQALSIGAYGQKARINNIILESNNIFEISTNTNVYGSRQKICANNMLLINNQCEIMIHALNPFIIDQAPITLKVIISGISYTKTLIKNNNMLYIAGNFTQTYANGNLPAIPSINPAKQSGKCGPNKNLACQILAYNLSTESLNTIASTNFPVNSIAVDNLGNLFIGGYFTQFIYNNTTIKTSTITDSLLIKLINNGGGFTASNWITDLKSSWKDPNGAISSIAINPQNNQLYVAGQFTKLGNYNAGNNSGYPVLQYSLNGGIKFINALGKDSKNPNAVISAIGINEGNNLYLSGYYSQISGLQFIDDVIPARIINKCSLIADGTFNCLQGSDYYVTVSGTTIFGQIQTINNLSFTPSGGLYAAGGINYIYFNSLPIRNILGRVNGPYLVALNSNPQSSFTYSPNYWRNSIESASKQPDATINIIAPYSNNAYFIAGQFATIGTIDIENKNIGECGASNSNSCLLAQFNGSSWRKVFTTDGEISAIAVVSGINIY